MSFSASACMLSQLTRGAQRQRLRAALGQSVNIAVNRRVVFFGHPGFRMTAIHVTMPCELFQVLGATKSSIFKRDQITINCAHHRAPELDFLTNRLTLEHSSLFSHQERCSCNHSATCIGMNSDASVDANTFPVVSSLANRNLFAQTASFLGFVFG